MQYFQICKIKIIGQIKERIKLNMIEIQIILLLIINKYQNYYISMTQETIGSVSMEDIIGKSVKENFLSQEYESDPNNCFDYSLLSQQFQAINLWFNFRFLHNFWEIEYFYKLNNFKIIYISCIYQYMRSLFLLKISQMYCLTLIGFNDLIFQFHQKNNDYNEKQKQLMYFIKFVNELYFINFYKHFYLNQHYYNTYINVFKKQSLIPTQQIQKYEISIIIYYFLNNNSVRLHEGPINQKKSIFVNRLLCMRYNFNQQQWNKYTQKNKYWQHLQYLMLRSNQQQFIFESYVIENYSKILRGLKQNITLKADEDTKITKFKLKDKLNNAYLYFYYYSLVE
ncbi:hypothetical protein pb186bvf_018076 [Paramecium bursaria]